VEKYLQNSNKNIMTLKETVSASWIAKYVDKYVDKYKCYYVAGRFCDIVINCWFCKNFN